MSDSERYMFWQMQRFCFIFILFVKNSTNLNCIFLYIYCIELLFCMMEKEVPIKLIHAYISLFKNILGSELCYFTSANDAVNKLRWRLTVKKRRCGFCQSCENVFQVCLLASQFNWNMNSLVPKWDFSFFVMYQFLPKRLVCVSCYLDFTDIL